jgi:farnesyl-diphosphate farnesyltransferase
LNESTNLRGVCEIFLRYSREIHRKSTPKDPNFLRISAACGKIEQFVESIFPKATTPTVEQLSLQAERNQRAEQNKMTAEERKEMYEIYMWVGVAWIVLLFTMSFIAWLFGARFDLMFLGIKDTYNTYFGSAGKEIVEGTPGRVEL